MSDVTLSLEYPIQDGKGNTLTQLVIRRPKARDIRKMKGNTDIEQNISLLALITGLVPEDLDALDILDLKAAVAVLEKMQKGK